jgi:hypothetical protein
VNRDDGLDNLGLVRRILAALGIACLVGAAIAFATGDDVVERGGVVRTHMDAFLVLATLGVGLAIGTWMVDTELRGRRSTPAPRRDDYADD